MLDLLKNLVLIQISADNVMLNMKWLLCWPVILFNSFIYWRAIKSFSLKKK